MFESFFKATCDWPITTAATTWLMFYNLYPVFPKPTLFSFQSLSFLTRISSDPRLFIPFPHLIPSLPPTHLSLTIQSIHQCIYPCSHSLPLCLIVYWLLTLAFWQFCLFLPQSLYLFPAPFGIVCLADCVHVAFHLTCPVFNLLLNTHLYTSAVTVPGMFSASRDVGGWNSCQMFLIPACRDVNSRVDVLYCIVQRPFYECL